MKKLTLIIGLGLGLASASAFGYDSRYENRSAYVSPTRSSGLDSRIDRLNRMLSHVRWELSRTVATAVSGVKSSGSRVT
jgi:hypothetical protein